MKHELTYQDLVAQIRSVFINQDKYFFNKQVPEYIQNGEFLGDFFIQTAFEPRDAQPPRFYLTFSPYDTISHKAPQFAAVIENGQQLLYKQIDDYITMRTAAMSGLLLSVLKHNVQNQKIVILGAGTIAKQAVIMLSEIFQVTEIYVVSKTNNLQEITEVGRNVNITVKPGSIEDLSTADIVLCHTKTDTPIITPSVVKQLKHGVFIASYISSTEHGEIADEVFDDSVNVIIDWQNTLEGAKDLQRSVQSDRFSQDNLISLHDLLTSKKSPDPNKKITIYRSTGTPLQNFAVLQLLLP